MLGEIYTPTGRALETASQVLETKTPSACNVALGCSNICSYCFNASFKRYKLKEGEIRFPKLPPEKLAYKQLDEGLKPEGVFLCFLTDPFISENKGVTEALIGLLLNEFKVKVATLSKSGISGYAPQIRNGLTIVSGDEKFREKFEPNALPLKERIHLLKTTQREDDAYTWISLEPCPPPAMFKQDLTELLDQINFVDFIIFGKLNHDKLGNDKEFYQKSVQEFQDYCKSHNIRHAVKSDTLAFIE